MSSGHYIMNSIIENVIIEKIRETIIKERLDQAEILAFFHLLQSRIEAEFEEIKKDTLENYSEDKDMIDKRYNELISEEI